MFRKTLQFEVFLFLLVLFGCLNPSEGVVQGFISVSPLCPVEGNYSELNCVPNAKTFESYPITLYRLVDGAEIEVDSIKSNLVGFYQKSLTPGSYVFKRNDSFFQPVSFSIQSNQVLDLNIRIDTGIR